MDVVREKLSVQHDRHLNTLRVYWNKRYGKSSFRLEPFLGADG